MIRTIKFKFSFQGLLCDGKAKNIFQFLPRCSCSTNHVKIQCCFYLLNTILIHTKRLTMVNSLIILIFIAFKLVLIGTRGFRIEIIESHVAIIQIKLFPDLSSHCNLIQGLSGISWEAYYPQSYDLVVHKLIRKYFVRTVSFVWSNLKTLHIYIGWILSSFLLLVQHRFYAKIVRHSCYYERQDT